jgi:hemolysin activation/secretion protein
VQSVRGFVEQGVLRDNGLLLRNELRGTPMATGMGRLVGAGEDTMVPFLFMDAGVGRNHHDIPGTRDSWVTVVTAGPGLTWRISESTALRFTWGFPLVRSGQTGPLLGPQFGTQVAF